ncbi:MAG: phytanoyl-CoA dioxygenase family protein [Gammaproteobacteria bacterium]|nr:phytanoyl-CoA dioxygenase family protein [Gammaproteobacteria bacterium]
MTPEQILAVPPRVLTQAQREFYFAQGYLLVENIIGEDWLRQLRAATQELVERSRQVQQSDAIFDLEPDHSAAHPRLRRVSNPTEHHPAFWAYCNDSAMPDVVADLVGPDVKFHHSKLNFKWQRGGEAVKWHYDISFWPHTNYSPLTVGTYLYDCGPAQGPLGVIPRSHRLDGPMLSQYDAQGRWVGCLAEHDIAALDPARAVYLDGPAGALTLHNCRTVHGSARNDSDLGRPLLLYTLTSADAFPYTVNPLKPLHDQQILRGQRARFAHHDPRPCLLPPDWSQAYGSIFSLQSAAAATGAPPSRGVAAPGQTGHGE